MRRISIGALLLTTMIALAAPGVSDADTSGPPYDVGVTCVETNSLLSSRCTEETKYHIGVERGECLLGDGYTCDYEYGGETYGVDVPLTGASKEGRLVLSAASIPHTIYYRPPFGIFKSFAGKSVSSATTVNARFEVKAATGDYRICVESGWRASDGWRVGSSKCSNNRTGSFELATPFVSSFRWPDYTYWPTYVIASVTSLTDKPTFVLIDVISMTSE